MKTLRFAVLIFAVTVIAAACFEGPKVSQGTVTKYDADTKTVVIKEEGQSGKELTVSLEGAEIGADPKEGDLVRVAYHDKGGKLKATRLMNLTRQSDLKKKEDKK